MENSAAFLETTAAEFPLRLAQDPQLLPPVVARPALPLALLAGDGFPGNHRDPTSILHRCEHPLRAAAPGLPVFAPARGFQHG